MKGEKEDFLFELKNKEFLSLPANTYGEIKSTALSFNEKNITGVELDLIKHTVKADAEELSELIDAWRLEEMKDQKCFLKIKEFIFDQYSASDDFASNVIQISCKLIPMDLSIRIKFESYDTKKSGYYSISDRHTAKILDDDDSFWDTSNNPYIDTEVYDGEDIKIILKDMGCE